MPRKKKEKEKEQEQEQKQEPKVPVDENGIPNVAPNRVTIPVVYDGARYTARYGDKEYSRADPLTLDRALDRAKVPRPRIFEVTRTD